MYMSIWLNRLTQTSAHLLLKALHGFGVAIQSPYTVAATGGDDRQVERTAQQCLSNMPFQQIETVQLVCAIHDTTISPLSCACHCCRIAHTSSGQCL